MKHILKGAAIMAVVIIVNMIINIIGNMNGVDLNSTATATVSAVCAMFIYDGWIRNEKNKENQE